MLRRARLLLVCSTLALPVFAPAGARAAYVAPTTANLALSHMQTLKDVDNTMYVFTGDVTNNNSASVASTMIEIRAYDAQNAFVDSVQTGPVLPVLAPGKSSPWRVELSFSNPGYDHFTVQVVGTELSTSVANSNFTTELYSTTPITDEYGSRTEVVGYVTSTNTLATASPYVWAVYRDAQGTVADVVTADVVNPDWGDVQQGTKLRWSYQLDGARRDRDAALGDPELVATSDSEPSPLPVDVGTRAGAVLAYNGTVAPTVRVAKRTTNGFGVNDGTIAVLQYLKGTTWTNVASVATHSDDMTWVLGYATFPAQRPRTSTSYRVVTPSNASTIASVGAAFRVQVRMAISAAWSAATVHPGVTTYLKGKTSVAHPGQAVALQRYYSGAWHTLTWQRLSSTSTYGFAIKPSKVGTYAYRVLKPTNAVNYASATAKMTLKVT